MATGGRLTPLKDPVHHTSLIAAISVARALQYGRCEMARALDDGGWSWLADPRAVFFAGRHRRTFMGWIDRDGDYEVQRWRTADGGASWQQRALSRGMDGDGLRPISPRGRAHERDVLWMQGRYRHYTDYRTTILARFAT